MLTFPRAMLPVDERALGPLLGTLMPRRLSGRNLIAQLLVGRASSGEHADCTDVLSEGIRGLIRDWLGLPGGMTPHTRRALHLARIRDVIHTRLHDPGLDPYGIAKAAAISPRYLHELHNDTAPPPSLAPGRDPLGSLHLPDLVVQLAALVLRAAGKS
jgi:hypothetical protein